MAKALRADLVETKLRDEACWLESRHDVLPGQVMNCPIAGCQTKYVLYNYVSTDAGDNRASLECTMRSYHPKHSQETIVVANARTARH